MKNLLKFVVSVGVMASLALSTNAGAAVVTSLAGTALPMQPMDYFGTSSQTLAPGITWTTTHTAVFGYTEIFALDNNGNWYGSTPFIGLNTDSGTMTFKFDQAVNGFGGFFNYAPGYGTPVIAAYDANGKLLESFTLNISTPNGTDAGQFYGFLDQTADISSFTMSNAYMVGKDFVAQRSANVPEPTSVCLMALGLLGVGAARRKSSKR